MGEGRSRAGNGTWGEIGRAFTDFCRVPGLESVKRHSVALGDRGVCPGAGCVPSSAGGLALAEALIKSSFPTANSEVIPNLFASACAFLAFPAPPA